MKQKIIKFKTLYSPYNDQVFRYKGCFVFKNSVIKDNDANYLLQTGKFNLKKSEQILDRHGISPYIIELADDKYAGGLGGYEMTDETSWFLMKLSKKKGEQEDKFLEYAKRSFVMEKVKTKGQFEVAKKISLKGFLTETATNPYDRYDDEGYCEILKRKILTQEKEISRWFIFKFKDSDEFFAGIDLAICGKTCYVSGLTILPEHRGTRAFLCTSLIVEYLKSENVKRIFCTTKTGGYPEKLYENLGFKKLFTIKQYTKPLA